jgi:eukaryotic translation initiation factor 2C
MGIPHKGTIDRFCKTIITALSLYGFVTNEFQVHAFDVKDIRDRDPKVRRANWKRVLDGAFNMLKSPPLIVAILPGEDASVYADIKRWANCIRGVPTVCVSPRAVWKNFNMKTKSGVPIETRDPHLLGNLW